MKRSREELSDENLVCKKPKIDSSDFTQRLIHLASRKQAFDSLCALKHSENETIQSLLSCVESSPGPFQQRWLRFLSNGGLSILAQDSDTDVEGLLTQALPETKSKSVPKTDSVWKRAGAESVRPVETPYKEGDLVCVNVKFKQQIQRLVCMMDQRFVGQTMLFEDGCLIPTDELEFFQMDSITGYWVSVEEFKIGAVRTLFDVIRLQDIKRMLLATGGYHRWIPMLDVLCKQTWIDCPRLLHLEKKRNTAWWFERLYMNRLSIKSYTTKSSCDYCSKAASHRLLCDSDPIAVLDDACASAIDNLRDKMQWISVRELLLRSDFDPFVMKTVRYKNAKLQLMLKEFA